ncbi:ovarian cancer G-protein coupled receptor 1-like [Anguilla rostrata]|uniref:ovarian cancer G-protein coupled receptor 1-like n=1 Tax=Anguilla rostrata TaxID=7938 RepID=UPI0030CE25AC
MDSNITVSSSNITSIHTVAQVISWVTFAIGSPVLCLVAYTLYHLVKTDHVTPVYIINLLITNIFSFIGRPNTAGEKNLISAEIRSLVFYYSVITNIVFMVCIAQERYLLVTRPVCLGSRHAVRSSALVSLLLWVGPLAVLSLAIYGYFLWLSVCLLPFPYFLFLCLDAVRALSCSTTLPSQEKRRILGTLTFILGNYIVIFLPFILNMLLKSLSVSVEGFPLETVASMLLLLSPLLDPLLFFCVHKSRRDILQAFPCCKGLVHHQEEPGSVPTISETVASV